MSEALKTFEVLAKLPQCVEVEPDEGCKKALLNLANNMLVQLPGNSGSGFSLWGNGGKSKLKLPNDCLVIPLVPRRIEAANDTETVKFLAGTDLETIKKVWQAQANQLFGEKA